MARARPLPALVTPLALAALAALAGCGPHTPAAQDGAPRPPRGHRKEAARLPDPLPVPKHPPVMIRLANPSATLAKARQWAPDLPDDTSLIQLALLPLARPKLASALAPTLDLARPAAAIRLDDQYLIALPLTPSGLDAAQRALEDLPAEGRFGAVRLGPPPDEAAVTLADPVALAWVDAQSRLLLLADSLPGLVAARDLPRADAAEPVQVEIAGDAAAMLVPELIQEMPYARLRLRADPAAPSLHLEIEQMREPRVLAALEELAGGGLGNLLDAGQLAWGATGRWAGHAAFVDTVTSDLTRTAQEQNFLIRGIATDLVRRANTTLRAWDGHLFLGAGPRHHALVGFGTADVPRAERAVLHLLRGVLDNLSLAKTFGVEVPSVSLRKGVARVGEVRVHEVVVRGLGRRLPEDARAAAGPMLRGDDLRLALAFPPRAGAAVLAVGPEAPKALASWVEAVGTRPPPSASPGPLLLARLAASAEQLGALDPAAGELALFALEADEAPLELKVERAGDLLSVRLGPVQTPVRQAHLSRDAVVAAPRAGRSPSN